MNLTLPTDSNERKEIPITSGVLRYFPAALAGVARVSKAGNDKHNPGEPLHHARGKSTDHADCIVRHLMDVQDLLTEYERRSPKDTLLAEETLHEASQLCWRALALSQELHERFGAPLAPGARLPEEPEESLPKEYAGPPTAAELTVEHFSENPAPCDPLPAPGFPITPGVYRSRDGRAFEIVKVVPGDFYPAKARFDSRTWMLNGRYTIVAENAIDLVERVSDLAKPAAPPPVVYVADAGDEANLRPIRPGAGAFHPGVPVTFAPTDRSKAAYDSAVQECRQDDAFRKRVAADKAKQAALTDTSSSSKLAP